MKPFVPPWPEELLREFCRAALLAWPGTKITIRNVSGEERGQPNKRPQPR